MILKKIIIFTFSIWALNLSAQYTLNHDGYIAPPSVELLRVNVESLQGVMTKGQKEDQALRDSLANEIKELSDYLFYRNLWDSYKVETSKEKRIIILRRMMLYRYSGLIDPSRNQNARLLYQESRKALIYEYSGNVELLETIEVNLAYQPVIYPFLKREILASGGEWKRGEILPVYSDRELFNYKKN